MLRDCGSKQGRYGAEILNAKRRSVYMLWSPNHDDSCYYCAVTVAVIVKTFMVKIIVSIIVVTAVINVVVVGNVVVAHSMDGFSLAQAHPSARAYPHTLAEHILALRTLNAASTRTASLVDTDLKLKRAA